MILVSFNTLFEWWEVLGYFCCRAWMEKYLFPSFQALTKERTEIAVHPCKLKHSLYPPPFPLEISVAEFHFQQMINLLITWHYT